MAISRMTSSMTDCATITTSGQTYAAKNSAITLLRRRLGRGIRQRRTFGHNGGGTRDRIGQIEFMNRGHERRLVGLAAEPGQIVDVGGSAGRDLVYPHQMRVRREQRLAQLRQRVIGQRMPERRR